MKNIFFLGLLSLSVIGFLTGVHSADYAGKTAKEVVQNHLKTYYAPLQDGSLCTSNACCNVTSTENCSLNKFARDQSSLILPGGDTRCIFSYSTPFAFQVIPGDSDNLLFYFQGGGVCWDQASTDAGGYCSTDSVPQPLVGIFDRSNEKNLFRSYTVVHVMYCSGDIHGGNVVRPYNDKAGQPVVQVGLNNVRSAINWVKDQITAGYLAKKFSKFVVMGCSAGSLGTQLWANELLNEFQWENAAVVPDSCPGVFPDGSFASIMHDVNFCDSGLLTPELVVKCRNKQLSLTAMNLRSMTNFPQVPFNYLESKTDWIQLAYYEVLAKSFNTPLQEITPVQFYNMTIDLFAELNTRKNFLTYLINGEYHCFTPLPVHYTADTKGPEDNGLTSKSPMVYEWLNNLPLEKGKSLESQCEVNLQQLETTYCSHRVVPKQYTEQA